MSYSKIELTFNRLIQIGEYINFTIENHIDTLTYANEECDAHRTEPGKFNYNTDQVSISVDVFNYKSAFGLDYNSTNLYTVTILGNIITIQAKADNYSFSAFSSTAGVTAVITNQTPVTLFDITDVSFSTDSGSECSHVSVDVTCNSEVTTVVSPTSIIGNIGNTVSFDFIRNSTFTLEVNNGVTTKTQYVTTPKLLAEPTVNVVNTPSGANVSIFGDTYFTLQYSLNGVDWKTTSVFTGLLDGTYVAYIKDQYGCVKTIYFDVDEFTEQVAITEPIAYISNTNPIRYKKDEIWDNSTIYKTDHNTLSCEENVDIARLYVQKFQTSDTIQTQIKSSYSNISARTIDLNGTFNALNIIKKTENIGLKDKRDALIHQFSDGRFGFYFTSGKTYDYDTGVENGTYELFGSIPFWAKVGQYFLINDTTYYKITNIEYDESINAQVLVIAEDLSGMPIDVISSVIYNMFSWDAYEFDIDMSAYNGNTFYVQVTFTDDDFDTVVWKSEAITVTSLLVGKYKAIKYSNSENNEIVWSTGIEFLLRLTYDTFGLASESEIEIHKTDNHVYKLDGSTYPKKQLILTYLSTMMARKVTQLFILDKIEIDGLEYTVESIDEPKRIGLTNLYNVTIKLYESKGRLETEASSSDTGIELDTIEIPNLIDSGDGFVEQ